MSDAANSCPGFPPVRVRIRSHTCKPITGPFASAAMALQQRRLAVLPVDREDGKRPLVSGWNRWKRPPGSRYVAEMIDRHVGANIGIVTGPLSGVTIVDVDGPSELVAAMIERCGDTPLQTRTPSGGVHLWYCHAGEPCANLRCHGLTVDVKGAGGFVVVPPSVRPSGAHAGAAYAFMAGTWDDLAHLPTVRFGALSPATDEIVATDDITTGADVHPLRNVSEGARNNTLFKALLREAKECDTLEELYAVAVTLNSQHCSPPLPHRELGKIAKSVWKYQETGKNWVGIGERRVHITETEFDLLKGRPNGADASFLLHTLRFAHWDQSEFAASPKAMAQAGVIPGWGHQRYRDALAVLVAVGLLRVVHEGGSRPGDPRIYVFGGAPVRCVSTSSITSDKGTISGPNITRHPPR